jgi:DNA-binding transcriptional ArsR family regulator
MYKTPMHKERILHTEAQAKAVQEVGFLNQFIEPTSPSDAAKKLGQSANLVHHHVQRHLELGLLREVKREGGKVLYQLTAQHFKVPRGVLPAGDPDHKIVRELGIIQKRFLEAYERSDRLNNGSDYDPDYDHYGFVQKGEQDDLPQPTGDPLEPHPAHFQARTLALSPKSYRRLVGKIGALIRDAEYERSEPGTGPCTLVFLGMDGELQTGAENSHYISSFVPPLKETA